jgi:hypothetical protein
MTTLISTPTVVRAPACGFDHYLTFNDCNQLHLTEADLLVVEPTFHDFATAENEQLAALFNIGTAMKVEPEKLVLAIGYTRKNADIFKGYLLDVVDFYKKKGYAHFTSTHVPYEAYGCPMVGSVLFMVFSKTTTVYNPPKQQVYPSQVFKDLLYHAPNGRMSGSIYSGTALLNGFLNSRRSFLPDFSGWEKAVLRCEYQNGNSSTVETLRKANINELFGVTQYEKPEDLHLCTPPAILSTLLNIKHL